GRGTPAVDRRPSLHLRRQVRTSVLAGAGEREIKHGRARLVTRRKREKLDGPAKIAGRSRENAALEKGIATRTPKPVLVGKDLDCVGVSGNGAIVVTGVDQELTAQGMGAEVVRIEPDRLGEIRDGAREVVETAPGYGPPEAGDRQTLWRLPC